MENQKHSTPSSVLIKRFLPYYKKRTFLFLPKLSLMRRLEMKLFLQSTIRQIKLKN